jgi:hypothetical protein
MKTVRLPFTQRRISVIYLFVFLTVITVSVGAFAASVTISSSNYAGAQGVYVQDNGYYLVTNVNYAVVEAAQSATTQPLAWTSGGVGYADALVAGDWAISFVITIEGGLTSHTYTITVTSTGSTGTSSTLFSFQFSSPASITTGQTMTIVWDTSSTTYTAPAALEVTIA